MREQIANRGTGANLGVALILAGVAVSLLTLWMIFMWTPIEASQGVMQRIYYVHVPVAWLTEFAFGMTALFGAVYLWLRDERADAAAVAAAEGGMFMAVILLIVGPLWGRVARGTLGVGTTPDADAHPILYLRRLLPGSWSCSGPRQSRAPRGRCRDRGSARHPVDPHERVLVPVASPRAGGPSGRRLDRRLSHRGDAARFHARVHAGLRRSVVVEVSHGARGA